MPNIEKDTEEMEIHGPEDDDEGKKKHNNGKRPSFSSASPETPIVFVAGVLTSLAH